MKNRITRKTLRRAGFLEREARLSALPEAPAHDFSPAFAQAAAPALAKGRRSALAQDFTRRTAAAMLSLMLALTAAGAAIPQARAEFLAWTRKISNSSVIYVSDNNADSKSLPDVILNYIPEGFKLETESQDKFGHLRTMTYINFETEEVIDLSIILFEENVDVGIDREQYGFKGLHVEEVFVNGYPADYVFFSDGLYEQFLFWQIEGNNVMFRLAGNIQKNVMLDIAENIEIID